MIVIIITIMIVIVKMISTIISHSQNSLLQSATPSAGEVGGSPVFSEFRVLGGGAYGLGCAHAPNHSCTSVKRLSSRLLSLDNLLY